MAGILRSRVALAGLAPLALIAAVMALFAILDGPGLGERTGPPVEEIVVERTVLKPGVIELTVRNDGPDEVRIAQALVNGAYVAFTGGEEPVGRLDAETLRLQQPWVEGEAYQVLLMTSSGATIAHEIPIAVETPDDDLSFFGLMALLGIYVGVIPVALGMLWLPWLRQIPAGWMRAVMALTVGLLVVLAIDATLEGMAIAAKGSQAFGGASLVLIGAVCSYLVLSGVSAWLARRASNQLALLIAIGIGLHNFGEGIAIGSSYAVGALALGATLVVGFAIHNTTEGLAIVAPVADRAPRLRRLVVLGLIAGGPAVLGAWVGAAAYNSSVVAFMFGLGVGAIAQVIVQLLPALRDDSGRTLHPVAVTGLLAGMAVMFGTGLLVSV